MVEGGGIGAEPGSGAAGVDGVVLGGNGPMMILVSGAVAGAGGVVSAGVAAAGAGVDAGCGDESGVAGAGAVGAGFDWTDGDGGGVVLDAVRTAFSTPKLFRSSKKRFSIWLWA